MATIEIKEEFLMNGSPFKLLSGAIHYFRVHPDDWEHSLYNLKALGFNTVETYVPWNLHEPHKGLFQFEGILDLERFCPWHKSLVCMSSCDLLHIYAPNGNSAGYLLATKGVWTIKSM